MRKILVLCAILLSVADSDLVAQSVSLGFETGVSSTQLVTPENYWGSRVGYVLGVSASVALSPWLAVQAGLRFHEKGAAVTDTFDMRIRYLEFPILVRFGVGRPEWPIRPLLTFGVAPAAELACAAQGLPPTLSQASASRLVSFDCSSDRTDLWDDGLIAGAGFEVRLGRLRAALLAQRTAGQHNIASGYPYGFPIHNRATSVVLSIAVPIWDPRPSNPRLQRSGTAASRPADGGAIE